jgi:glycosyltransferase involved in cell wall biosynthesis
MEHQMPSVSILIPFDSEEPNRLAAHKFVLKGLPSGVELITGGEHPSGFERATARNILAAHAIGDVLVFLDADSYVDPGDLLFGVDWAMENSGWGFPYQTYGCLNWAATQRVLLGQLDPQDTVNEDFEHVFPSLNDPEPSVGGCVIVSRKAFERVNGYDERFKGWGFEDRAFARSLTKLVGPPIYVASWLFHLWHPTPESERFEQPHMKENQQLWFAYRDAGKNEMEQLIRQH